MPTDLIYLDHNATTPIDPRVLAKMLPFLEHEYGNAASRDHALGWNAAEAVEEARYYVADLIGAKPTEITFTSGATEAVNVALKGLAFAPSRPIRRIVTSPTEHAGGHREFESALASCGKRSPAIGPTYQQVGKKSGAVSVLRRAAQLDPAVAEREKLGAMIRELGG